MSPRTEMIAERIRTLKLMDKAIRNFGDDFVFEAWLMNGVPDEASEDDYEYIAGDDFEYDDVLALYIRLTARIAKRQANELNRILEYSQETCKNWPSKEEVEEKRKCLS